MFDYENAEMPERMKEASDELQQMFERLVELQQWSLSPDQKTAQKHGQNIHQASKILQKTMNDIASEAEFKFDIIID